MVLYMWLHRAHYDYKVYTDPILGPGNEFEDCNEVEAQSCDYHRNLEGSRQGSKQRSQCAPPPLRQIYTLGIWDQDRVGGHNAKLTHKVMIIFPSDKNLSCFSWHTRNILAMSMIPYFGCITFCHSVSCFLWHATTM